jgi:hypothetical protein
MLAWVAGSDSTWSGRRIEIIDEAGAVQAVLAAEKGGATLSLGAAGNILVSAPGSSPPELRIGGPSGTVLTPGHVALGGWDAGTGVSIDAASARVDVRSSSARCTLEAPPGGPRLVLIDGVRERIYTAEGP